MRFMYGMLHQQCRVPGLLGNLAMIKHLLCGWLTVFAALAAVNAAGRHTQLQRFAFTEPHMGTLFRIVLYAPDEATAKKAAQAAFARIAQLDSIMSDYRPASELLRLCQKAGGPPVLVSPDLFAILTRAQEVSKLTEGAFDVTVGPIVKLWRRARRTRQLPNTDDLARAVALVGYRNIRLDPVAGTVQLLVKGVLLDLGGIAKGYAAEAALEVLRRLGLRQALVAAGGDIAVADPPPEAKGWKVGIAPLKNPEAPPEHYLLLHNAAVSTSGDSEQFVEIDGKRYSHIIDLKTGMGLVGRRSVSVIARHGATADSLATALCVLGPERGLSLIEKTEGAAALFVLETAKGIETMASKRFADFRFELAPKPQGEQREPCGSIPQAGRPRRLALLACGLEVNK